MPTIEPREITESFRLERVLKSSRSAIVFRATDPGSGGTVAIKLIPPASPAALEACQERFLTAMAALAPPAPPAFPALLDHGFTPDGSAFMVMEFVEGERLDALIGAAPARILGLALEVVQGLAALARAGASHGNISPENILSHRRAGVEHVSILGFGTAAFHKGVGVPTEKVPPAAPMRFVAPERLGPAGTGDWRADLFALAATCCALLRAEVTGGDAPVVTLPQAVSQRIPEPAVLARTLGQALCQDPAARPASLEAFRQAIATALSGGGLGTTPVAAAPAGTPPGDAGTAAAGPEPPAVEAVTAGEPDIGEDTAPARVVPILPVPATEPEAPQATAETAPADEESAGGVSIQPPPKLAAAPDVDDTAATRSSATFEAEQRPEAAPALSADAAVSDDQPQPEPAPEEAAPVAKPGRRRTALWVAGAAAAVVLAAVGGAIWYPGTRPARTVRTAAPTPAPRRPTSPPAPAAVPAAVVQLQMAEAAIALGDLAEAQSRLDAISPAELAALAPADRDRFKELRSSYLAKRQRAATREIQSALAAGNMAALAGALRGLSRADEAGFPRDADFIATVEDARRALDVHTALLKAQRQGELGEVIRNAGVLIKLAPHCAQAAEMRSRAAAAIEREADALATAGNYESALARLATVGDVWPDRPGLAARIARLGDERAAQQKFTAVMAQVEQAERDRAPENGLALLHSVVANTRTDAAVEEARKRLEKQLEQLDAGSPTVALGKGLKLEYKKGAPAAVTLSIRDDHRVKGARFFARVEGAGEFVELPMRRGAGEDWSVEISPEFHHNQTVEFYVTAADYSNHVGGLGSEREPLKLKRKKWSLFGR